MAVTFNHGKVKDHIASWEADGRDGEMPCLVATRSDGYVAVLPYTEELMWDSVDAESYLRATLLAQLDEV